MPERKCRHLSACPLQVNVLTIQLNPIAAQQLFQKKETFSSTLVSCWFLNAFAIIRTYGWTNYTHFVYFSLCRGPQYAGHYGIRCHSPVLADTLQPKQPCHRFGRILLVWVFDDGGPWNRLWLGKVPAFLHLFFSWTSRNSRSQGQSVDSFTQIVSSIWIWPYRRLCTVYIDARFWHHDSSAGWEKCCPKQTIGIRKDDVMAPQ